MSWNSSAVKNQKSVILQDEYYPKHQQSSTGHSALTQNLFNLLKKKQQEITRLRKELNQEKSKERHQHMKSNNQASVQNLIGDLEKKQRQDLQEVRNHSQRCVNKLKLQHKQQINTIQAYLQAQYGKEWKQKLEAKDKLISNLQRDNDQLKKQMLDYNKILANEKELAITKKLLEQAVTSNKQITDKDIKEQQEFRTQQQRIGQQTDKALLEMRRVNQDFKNELARIKDTQNKNFSQKIKLLKQSQIAYLQIMATINQLEKNIQNAQIKKIVRTFTNQINQQLRQQSHDLAKQKSMGLNFEAIVKQVVTHVKKLQKQKAKEKQQTEKTSNNFKNEINALKQQNVQITRKLQESSNSLEITKSDLQTCKKQLKKKSDQKLTEQSKYKEKIALYQRKITELQNKLKNQIKLKNDEIKIKNDKIIQMQTKNDRLQSENAALNQTISRKQADIKKLQNQLEKSREENNKLLRESNSIKIQNNKLKEQIKQLKKKIEQLEKKIKERDNQISKLQQQSQSLKTKIIKLQNQIKTLKAQIQKLKNQHKAQIYKVNSELAKLNKKNISLENQIYQVKSEIEDKQSEIRFLRPYEEFCKQINKSLINELAYYIAKEKVSLDINAPQSIQYALNQFKKFYNQAKYFAGSEVLQLSQVSFVIDAVSKFNQKTIEQTKLIYRFDPKNNNNIHKYIDGKQNMVVLIRIANNYVVGGYTYRPVQKIIEKEKARQVGLGKGIIFNVTKEKIFQLKKQHKTPVVSYDDYYFIFGNSQLRIKTQDTKLFSNFAVSAAIFDSAGWQKIDFLGEANSEVNITSYEFYQIKFRE